MSETSKVSSSLSKVSNLPASLVDYQAVAYNSTLPNFQVPNENEVIFASIPAKDEIGQSADLHEIDQRMLPVTSSSNANNKAHLLIISEVSVGRTLTSIFAHKLRSFTGTTIEFDPNKRDGSTRLVNRKLINNNELLINAPLLFAGSANLKLTSPKTYVSGLRVAFSFSSKGEAPNFKVSVNLLHMK